MEDGSDSTAIKIGIFMNNMEDVRIKTLSVLQKNDVPFNPNLPLLDEVSFRSADDVCKRIVSLYALAGLANGAKGDLLKEWLIDEGGWEFLSKDEQRKLERGELSQAELNELSWKQESLYTLCWCGGLVDKLAWPAYETDLTSIFPLIPPEKSIPEFFDSFSLRSSSQLIGELDLYYSLHAAMMHPELWDKKNTRLKIEVILERRQALEWICSTSVLWNEVSLDT